MAMRFRPKSSRHSIQVGKRFSRIARRCRTFLGRVLLETKVWKLHSRSLVTQAIAVGRLVNHHSFRPRKSVDGLGQQVGDTCVYDPPNSHWLKWRLSSRRVNGKIFIRRRKCECKRVIQCWSNPKINWTDSMTQHPSALEYGMHRREGSHEIHNIMYTSVTSLTGIPGVDGHVYKGWLKGTRRPIRSRDARVNKLSWRMLRGQEKIAVFMRMRACHFFFPSILAWGIPYQGWWTLLYFNPVAFQSKGPIVDTLSL